MFARPNQTYDDDLLRISYHFHEVKGFHFNSVTAAEKDELLVYPALPYVMGAKPKLPTPPPMNTRASACRSHERSALHAEATKDRPKRSASRGGSDSSPGVGALKHVPKKKKKEVSFEVPEWEGVCWPKGCTLLTEHDAKGQHAAFCESQKASVRESVRCSLDDSS